MSELKVGDLISERYHGVYGEIWTSKQVLKINRYGDLRDDSIIVQGGILYFKDTNWQHGIHPSLIPEGFAIVPIDEIEAAKVELSKLKIKLNSSLLKYGIHR